MVKNSNEQEIKPKKKRRVLVDDQFLHNRWRDWVYRRFFGKATVDDYSSGKVIFNVVPVNYLKCFCLRQATIITCEIQYSSLVE